MSPSRQVRILATAVAAVLFASIAGSASAKPDLRAIIVQGDKPGAAAAAVSATGGRVTRALAIVDGVAAQVPASALATLEREPGIRAVTPDAAMRPQSTNDPAPTVKSVFAREVNAPDLWGAGIQGQGVRVALVDTGVSPVADLAGRIVPVPDPSRRGGPFVDCVDFSGEGQCNDSYGHGTFMAGLIAGNGSASGGLYTGIAPKAQIVSVKIAGHDGSADVSKVLAAIQWVVSFSKDLNIKVLNLSLGTNSRASWRIDPLNLAVERAWRAGIVVVVSAGNRGPALNTISKPADDPLVVTVGAVDDRETPGIDDDRLPSFSARGPAFMGTPDQHPKPDVVAPGGRVISLRSPGSFVERNAPGGFPSTVYRRGSGTSMAAAVVSGVAALIAQAQPSWTPDRVKFALMTTARKVAERDVNAVGVGLVDASAAIAAPLGNGNANVQGTSDGSGSLDGSRGDVFVSRSCKLLESALDPQCDRVHGDTTAQDMMWDRGAYATQEWTGSSWYDSQWLGSSWYGSSWYGCSAPSPDISSCWYGSSWYGSSWYGGTENTFYGTSVAGSSWYGAWQ